MLLALLVSAALAGDTSELVIAVGDLAIVRADQALGRRDLGGMVALDLEPGHHEVWIGYREDQLVREAVEVPSGLDLRCRWLAPGLQCTPQGRTSSAIIERTSPTAQSQGRTAAEVSTRVGTGGVATVVTTGTTTVVVGGSGTVEGRSQSTSEVRIGGSSTVQTVSGSAIREGNTAVVLSERELHQSTLETGGPRVELTLRCAGADAVEVWVDGELGGRLDPGETRPYRVQPGSHYLAVRRAGEAAVFDQGWLDTAYAHAVTVAVSAGTPLAFDQHVTWTPTP